ncbi:carbohydrate porin [Dyella sp. A6]|uniref:carbohydrate porin n=1 Tax=Dyella aluminiiresistens TaxID=3069105 RepID=UPI002E76A04E|nr:carbohydrate porin [Dyella sp. A6]
MRSKMLAVAIATGLGVTSFATVAAPAQTHKHHVRVVRTSTATEIAELKAQLAALQQKVDQLQNQSTTQEQVQQQTAQQVQQVQAQQQAQAQQIAAAPSADLQKKVDNIEKFVNNTKIGGKMYFDFSNIDQKNSDTGKTNNTGFGFDIKRFYLGVDHKFNDTWSANLTTDIGYSSSTGATNLFVKKAYVQGKFDKAFILRVGSADMPWIPFVENWYGFRYVENTITDRLHFANSADWGAHALGTAGAFNYAVSVVNGNGYKNPGRSKGMDVEARIGFEPVKGLMVALGGYDGNRGKETQNTSTQHTASRGDLMVAYHSSLFRAGVEYFNAKDWNNVTTVSSDKAHGYSLWASVPLNDEWAVFGRYDNAKLSQTLNPQNKDVYYNLGLQYKVTKGFDLAAVWKHDTSNSEVSTPVPAHVQKLKTNEIGVFGQVAF